MGSVPPKDERFWRGFLMLHAEYKRGLARGLVVGVAAGTLLGLFLGKLL